MGAFAIACAAAEDVTAWRLLAVITVIARPDANAMPLGGRFAALGDYILAMVAIVRPVLRRVLPTDEPQFHGRFGAVMILLLVSVWVTEALSVHVLFGAFLAAIVMPKGGKLEAELGNRLESVTVVLLLPLSFA